MHVYHFGRESELLENFEDWAIFEIDLPLFVNALEKLDVFRTKESSEHPLLSISKPKTNEMGIKYCHLNLGFPSLGIRPSLDEGIDNLINAIYYQTPKIRVFFSGEVEVALELELIEEEELIEFSRKIRLIDDADASVGDAE